MTPKRKKTRTPAGLLPAFAIKRFAKPIQHAQAAAEAADEALERGQAAAAEAKAAAEAAPAHDADALAEALKAGKTPPNATAPDRKREAETAERAVAVLRAERDKARVDLHRAIADALPGCMETQNGIITELRDKAEAKLAEIEPLLAELEREQALAEGLRQADGYYENVRGERRLSRAGKLNFTRVRRHVAPAMEPLRSALANFTPPTASVGTERQEAERQARERQQRERAMVAQGDGIYIGGGAGL